MTCLSITMKYILYSILPYHTMAVAISHFLSHVSSVQSKQIDIAYLYIITVTKTKSYIVQYGRSGKKKNCHINISWHQVYVNSICKSDYNQTIRNPVVSNLVIWVFQVNFLSGSISTFIANSIIYWGSLFSKTNSSSE